MSQTLFANNARASLAAPLTNVATTATLASGQGALFPSPSTSVGQYFVMTFVDAATGAVREIVWVTAVSGDTLTIVRGQEGTIAQSWLAGDLAANLWTAGQAANAVQPGGFFVLQAAGALVLPTTFSGEVVLNKTTPATTAVTLPSAAPAGATVLVTDGSYNASAFPATMGVTDLSTITGPTVLAADGGMIRYKKIATNIWLATLISP